MPSPKTAAKTSKTPRKTKAKPYPRKPLASNKAAQQKFLDAVAEGHSLEKSARAAGYTRRAFLNLRDANSDFQQLFEDAYDAGTDQREDILDEVVWEGERIEYYDRDGNLSRVETRHDTRAMLAVLAARRPERWSQKTRQEITGPGGGPMEVTSPDAAALAAAVDRFTSLVRRHAERSESGGAVRALGARAAELPPAAAGS